MTPTSPTIVFFGTEWYSLIALKALVEADFNVAAVITKPDTRSGRGHKLTFPPVKVYAQEHGITVWQPLKLSEIAEDIAKLQPVFGVLVAYGKIIPQSIIDLFDPGIINLHPSLLPRWRGPSPIEAAIAHQNDQTGLSIMKLSAAMDAGPVYAQCTRSLDGHETKPELYQELFTNGSQFLVEQLPHIISGELQPVAQNDAKATYCSLLSKADSLIDPTELTAAAADAHVRAHLGFPRTRINLLGENRIVTATHVATQPETDLDVQCADGQWLIIDQLIAPSGKTLSAADFLRGQQK